jgi:hypothetical protein
MAKAEKELAKHLRNNISYLAGLIPRQPSVPPTENRYLPVWAATPDEAFSLFSDTNKITWALSYSEIADQNGRSLLFLTSRASSKLSSRTDSEHNKGS